MTTDTSSAFATLAASQKNATPAPTPIASKPSLAESIWNGIAGIGKAVLTPVLPGLNPNSIAQTIAAAKGGINQIKGGVATINSGVATPVQGAEAGGNIEAGAISTIASPLAPIFNLLSGAITDTTNPITDNPDFQKFAKSPHGQVLARVLQDSANAGTISGGILGADQLSKINTPSGAPVNPETTGQPINAKLSLDDQLNQAEQARQETAKTGVDSINEIQSGVNNYKTSLGNTFAEAPKQIEQVSPSLKVTLPNDIIDRLNALKDTKTFALPDYLRTSSENYADGIKLGDIEHGGISLSPTDAQDLIARLNKLTYSAKASGDLGVNQQTIGLNKDIHSLASEAFGSVKDASGKSIWDIAYQNYSKGSDALEKLSDITDLNKNMTATDLSGNIKAIQKLSETPEGKIILQNTINDFKTQSGIDLTNPTQAIQKIMDSQETLDTAKAAKEKGTFGERVIRTATNPERLTQMAMRIAALSTIGYVFRSQIEGLIKSAGL